VPAAPQASRREFVSRLAAGSALAAGASTAGYGAIFGRHDYTIEEVVVRIPGLPRALEGYTLVQLSDVHFGQYIGEREIAAASSLVKDARPDMVVLTGDLIDHDIRYAPLLGAFARRLGQHAKHGVVSAPGNHDHYAGLTEVNATLRAAGARVLMNEGIVIGEANAGVALLGVDDVWGARRGRGLGPNLDRAIASVPRELPRVLLCHNPAFFPEASGRVALQLSGHTHGGQVNFLFRPADMLLPFGYVSGRYDRDGSELWVNRGFGTAGPPLRVGAPPEVTRVVLVAA
jgi:predicted MPP superfamily phosphohydrolase